MAKKSIFQEVTKEELENTGMVINHEFGVCIKNTNNPDTDDFEIIKCTESNSIWSNLCDLLKEETTTSMIGMKHAFLLPSCAVSADRVKETLKEHKIYLTNDYEKADFIITHDDVQGYNEDFTTTKMFQHLVNKYIIENHLDAHDDVHAFTEFIQSTAVPVLYDGKISKSHALYNFEYESAPHDLYIVSDLAIKLAHKVLEGEMQVVDLETVMESSANKRPLTQELLEQINAMMNSGGEDRELAATLLPTISKKSSPFLLWELACGQCTRIENNFTRHKDVKWWLNDINLRRLYHMSAENAIEHFDREGTLTPEEFRKFEPICRKDINISNRELYTFKVQVKPEWLHYVNPKKYPKLKQIKTEDDE